MEKNHGSVLENAHFAKKQGYINDRIRNLEGQQDDRKYNHARSNQSELKALRIRQMEEEHEAKKTYHKLRRERKHYESKLADLEGRQSERHRSDKEQR
jgi:hypothetical protein